VASFEILYKPSVEKDLLLVPKSTIARILTAIDGLADNPFPRQSLKLKGTEQLHRLRVGNYRIAYKVDPVAKRIVIQHVRHRRDVYRNL
jgi:mRNA interferase RelE/StbE